MAPECIETLLRPILVCFYVVKGAKLFFNRSAVNGTAQFLGTQFVNTCDIHRSVRQNVVTAPVRSSGVKRLADAGSYV
jgi:hypothetical protein